MNDAADMAAYALIHEIYESLDYPAVSVNEAMANVRAKHVLYCAASWIYGFPSEWKDMRLDDRASSSVDRILERRPKCSIN
jgi:hypothetical protein